MQQETQTQNPWLQKVKDNAAVLRQLVADWHPSARQPKAIQRQAVIFTDGGAVAINVPEAYIPITAPNAEQACRNVREKIRQEEPQNPLDRWDKAIKEENVGEISSLLSGAWFGVPESTSCWQIPGFAVACDLLDDPPDELRYQPEEGEE